MLFSKLSVSVLLSLLLALGVGISQAHSHDGHEAEECIFSVVQITNLAIASEIVPFISVPINTCQPIAYTESVLCSLRAISQARAPPFLTSK